MFIEYDQTFLTNRGLLSILLSTQSGITYSKLTTETLKTVWNEFKFNSKDIRATPGVFIVNFKHISHLVLVFLLSTLNR